MSLWCKSPVCLRPQTCSLLSLFKLFGSVTLGQTRKKFMMTTCIGCISRRWIKSNEIFSWGRLLFGCEPRLVRPLSKELVLHLSACGVIPH